jgi:DNA-binding NtrC family response regulator
MNSLGLVGESPQICQIRRNIEKLGRSKSPVLLLGESGTGKEVIARAIHNTNPAGNFVPIDCGSLVGPLMESELFAEAAAAAAGAGVPSGGVAGHEKSGDPGGSGDASRSAPRSGAQELSPGPFLPAERG